MSTVSDKLTYLNGTKQKLKEVINAIGGNLTNESTFRSYVNVLNQKILGSINGEVDLYDEYPKVTGEGTDLTLNTEKGKMSVVLEGNTSQDGEPTPDNYVDIKVVTGEQKITIQNKNLFNKDDFEYLNGYRYGNKMYIQSTESNKIVCIKCTPNTTYTVSSEGDHTTFIIWTYNNELPEMTTSRLQYNIQQVTTSEGAAQYTLTTNNDAKYLMIWFGSAFESNKDSLQVEIGDVKTEYEPYQSQNYPIDLGNIELCKIGNYQDYIYNDNGDWYLHKEIYKYIFDGDENWNNNYGTNLFGVSGAFNTTPFIVGYGLSNYYRYKSVQSGINNNTVHGEFALQKSGSSYSVFIKNTDINTVENFKTWLNLHNTIVYFPLVTPIDTQITDSTLIQQLENINNNAKSYSEITIIESESINDSNEKIMFNVSALKSLDI